MYTVYDSRHLCRHAIGLVTVTNLKSALRAARLRWPNQYVEVRGPRIDTPRI